MRAGALNKRITFQTAAYSEGVRGRAETVTWSDAFSVWAAIWPLRGLEFLDEAQRRGSVSHRIRIRYRPGVSVKNRIKLVRHDEGQTVYFNIISAVNLNEQNHEIEIMAEETID